MQLEGKVQEEINCKFHTSSEIGGIFLQFEGWGMSLPMDQKYQVPTLRHGSHYRLRHTQPVQLLPLLRLPKGLTLRVLDGPSSVTHGGSSTSAASALWHKAQDGPTIPSGNLDLSKFSAPSASGQCSYLFSNPESSKQDLGLQ
ncbi:hypothetical protein JEQ12_004144 [Ovis aries]|uniref:Uncharacterized protein n=1 Tax=Ovis aries TaxID=9940 RepID=A0A836A3A6_SHEEP|nr:hypothetical protein JEQ12_004144 [Ovis aries]